MGRPILSRRALAAGALAALLAWPATASRAESTADATSVIKKALEAQYYGGKDMVAQVTMTLFDAAGKSRTRKLSMLRKNASVGGEQKYFMYFHTPPDVAGMTFLVHKLPEKDDDRWIFIPAVRMVKRVAASDKRSSFAGSDFTYEDVSGRDLGDESAVFIRSENVGDRACHVLESKPKEATSYAKRISWIDKERFLPLKEEFINEKGEVVRRFSADELKDVSGVWTIAKRTMTDLRTGRRTEVMFDGVRYGVGLEDDIFTEAALRSPPRQWLK